MMLPIIAELDELTQCPHCGGLDFSLRYRYLGKGAGPVDPGAQTATARPSRAYCLDCDKPVAAYAREYQEWNEETPP